VAVRPASAPASRRPALASGERIALRRPHAADEPAFVQAMRASVALHSGKVRPPLTSAAFADFVQLARRSDRRICLAVRRQDEAIVGVITLGPILGPPLESGPIGYYGVAEHTGQGYVTEAVRLMLRHGFASLRLHRVEAAIQADNARSLALVRRLGFRKEGVAREYLKVDGQWRDHEIWSLLASEWPAPASRGP
jgi:ribosomal-protein-alanine N-acetyltransferase